MNKNPLSAFTEVLLIVFIALKLTGNIDWSWWWVLSPFWIVSPIVVAWAVYKRAHMRSLSQSEVEFINDLAERRRR